MVGEGVASEFVGAVALWSAADSATRISHFCHTCVPVSLTNSCEFGSGSSL